MEAQSGGPTDPRIARGVWIDPRLYLITGFVFLSGSERMDSPPPPPQPPPTSPAPALTISCTPYAPSASQPHARPVRRRPLSLAAREQAADPGSSVVRVSSSTVRSAWSSSRWRRGGSNAGHALGRERLDINLTKYWCFGSMTNLPRLICKACVD
ncbi:hypothetical protein VPH35_047622 [Triticum aestivum]